MLILTTAALPTIKKFARPNLGRLLTPRHYPSAAETAEAGIPWAADNDAFNDSYSDEAFERMVKAIAYLPGCLFVTAPDVVGDALRTAYLFDEWAPFVLRYELPVALVLQDGIEGPEDVPWGSLDAVFVGGTNDFKGSPVVAECVAEARRRGKWAHMGRVNSRRRLNYAASVGCDSIDGSGYSRWRDRDLRQGLLDVSAGRQLALGGEE